jgi:hypothetical protein
MKQQQTYSFVQSYTYTPGKYILQGPYSPLTPSRTSKCVSFVLGLALGTGMAVLLSLLSAWFFPPTSATAASVRSGNQAQVWTPSPSEVEESGLSPALLADPFARF